MSTSLAASRPGSARCASTRAPPNANMSRNGLAISWAEATGMSFPNTPRLRLVHSFTWSDDDRRAAAPGVAAARHLAGLRVACHGLDPPEVQVALPPALHRPATSFQRVERARV